MTPPNPQPRDEPSGSTIRLDQFLKLAGLVGTGGQAKQLIQSGEVLVNGVVETRRSRKLQVGDVIHCDGLDVEVSGPDEPGRQDTA